MAKENCPSVEDLPGFYIEGRHIYDRCGEKVIFRGVNRMTVIKDIPFIIGEFSHITVGCKGDIPYRHIMAEAKRLGIGWLAWWWGPGNSDCESMDMTTDATFESLKGWGLETAVEDPNSIKNTLVRPRSMVNGVCISDD